MPESIEPSSNPKPVASSSQASPTTDNHSRIKGGMALLVGRGARDGYLAAVDQGVISLANFLATLILARVVSPTELGVYGVGFTSLRLIRSFQEGLTIQPVNTFGAGLDEASFRRYASNTSLIQLGLAILSALGAAVLGWILIITGNDTAGPAVLGLWFPFLTWQIQEYLRRLLYTRGEIFNAVINTVLANSVRIGLMIWWVGGGRLDGISGLTAIAWGSLVAMLPGIWLTRRYWSPSMLGLGQTWRQNWEFGRWVLGSQLANWVAVEFYPVLTAGMINFAAAGAYRALQNLVAPIHLLLRATDTFLTPRAARVFSNQGWKPLARTIRLTYILSGIPIAGILALASIFRRPLLELLYGSAYVEYADGLLLMALFYLLWFAYSPLQTAFKATRTSRPIFVANAGAILAMFTLGIWMIQNWGVYGTIAGQGMNSLIVAVVLWWSWIRLWRKNDQYQTQN